MSYENGVCVRSHKVWDFGEWGDIFRETMCLRFVNFWICFAIWICYYCNYCGMKMHCLGLLFLLHFILFTAVRILSHVLIACCIVWPWAWHGPNFNWTSSFWCNRFFWWTWGIENLEEDKRFDNLENKKAMWELVWRP